MSIMLAWIGKSDLIAAGLAPAFDPSKPPGPGPILSAVSALPFKAVHLLSDYDASQACAYIDWLEQQSGIRAALHPKKLISPTNHEEIYCATKMVVDRLASGDEGSLRGHRQGLGMTFHLSPGTPAMAAIWLLLAKTRYRAARLIESSPEQGVKEINFPFDLSAEFIPGPTKEEEDTLIRLAQGLSPEAAAFGEIIHRCEIMKRTVLKARRLAQFDVPVLIQGESGTGKELFAKAIHKESERGHKPLIAVNCGAIPENLIESELFGHAKGAFTGSVGARKGYFEVADKSTLFLDEIGELPLAMQVRLLRVLQEGAVTPVGSTAATKIDVRIIAATNRDLPAEVRAGRFREDLYHRLAVGVLRLPPLRERDGDLGLLIDSMLASINEKRSLASGHIDKKIDPSARNLLLTHSWPGNARELLNVLSRASIWAAGDTITGRDIAESLDNTATTKGDTILGRPFGQDFSLKGLISQVARHYLDRAMAEAHGNKTEAARLLGLGSYQTLSNWLQKHPIE